MEQSSPIVRCGRPQVGGFNVRHAPRVNAETNATVMISANPFPSLTYPARPPESADEGVRGSIGCRERRPAQGHGGAPRCSGGPRRRACRDTRGDPSPQDSISVLSGGPAGPSAAPDVINSAPVIPQSPEPPKGCPSAPTPRNSLRGNPLSPAPERSIEQASRVQPGRPSNICPPGGGAWKFGPAGRAKVCVAKTRLMTRAS